MTTSLELVKKTHQYLEELKYKDMPDCGCCVTIYTVSIPGSYLINLLDSLLSHSFILESTCNDCEEIQNSIDNLCETILEGDNLND